MTTTTSPARHVFRVLGTTDEVTECEHCGRVDLKGTIRLGVLDADGNVEDVTHFGAVCGARAAGWTTRTAANRYAAMSNADLHDAFAKARRTHPDEWNHPRVQAIRDEMVRRAITAGYSPTR